MDKGFQLTFRSTVVSCRDKLETNFETPCFLSSTSSRQDAQETSEEKKPRDGFEAMVARSRFFDGEKEREKEKENARKREVGGACI